MVGSNQAATTPRKRAHGNAPGVPHAPLTNGSSVRVAFGEAVETLALPLDRPKYHLRRGSGRRHVSGGIKGSHFRRVKAAPTGARPATGHTTTPAAGGATRGQVQSLPRRLSAQATLPRRQREQEWWKRARVWRPP